MSGVDLNELNQRFAIAGHLSFKEGPGGLAVAEIANSHAQASIALQGAHVMTFQPQGQAPVLWLSQYGKFAAGKSIRGGVPVCWPWFGPHPVEPGFPAHGFARTVMWEVLDTSVGDNGETRINFGLIETDVTHTQWPHTTSVQVKVTVGAALSVELVTLNNSNQSFEIGEALHTYFHISDIADVQIKGLEQCEYLDKMEDFARKTQQGSVVIESEVDRVYLNTSADCLIEDQGLNRSIRIATRGSRSTVVWNPWIEKADKMGDFGQDGYRGMVCVETANAFENIVTVAPGAAHSLVTIISVAPL